MIKLDHELSFWQKKKKKKKKKKKSRDIFLQIISFLWKDTTKDPRPNNW